MGKRFTDTEKFTDPWYRRLESKNKILWDWILCACDQAGFISIDFEFVEMVLNEKYEDDTIEKHFSDRVFRIGQFKYFIPKFIKFQYGKLNPNALIHKSIIKKLEAHGIDYLKIDEVSVMPAQIYVQENDLERRSCSFNGVKDKDKEKEKDSYSSSSLKSEQCEKNLPEKNSKAKRKTLEKSPLAFLFDANDEIQSWLLTGTEAVQTEIVSRFKSFPALPSEIKRAYFWQVEKESRLAGTYLLNWLSDSKTFGKAPNQAKVQVSASNPTGNPYLEKARQIQAKNEMETSA